MDSKHADAATAVVEDDEVRMIRLASEYLATLKWPQVCPFTHKRLTRRVRACAACIVNPSTATLSWVAIDPDVIKFNSTHASQALNGDSVDAAPKYGICTGNGGIQTTFTPL